jgi:hypothetical protein
MVSLLLTVRRRQRCRSRRRSAFAGTNIECPATLVFARSKPIQLSVATGDRLMEYLLQERDTPTAARPCAATLRQLAWHLGPGLANIVRQLPPRNVKAITNLRIKIHGSRIQHIREWSSKCRCSKSEAQGLPSKQCSNSQFSSCRIAAAAVALRRASADLAASLRPFMISGRLARRPIRARAIAA